MTVSKPDKEEKKLDLNNDLYLWARMGVDDLKAKVSTQCHLYFLADLRQAAWVKVEEAKDRMNRAREALLKAMEEVRICEVIAAEAIRQHELALEKKRKTPEE
jgi:hypothetical protein